MAEAVKKRPGQYRGANATYGSVAYDLNQAGTTIRQPAGGGAEVLRPKPRTRQRTRALTRPMVRVREAGQVSPFAVIGFLAVGVFAALLLMSYVQLTTTTDQIAVLKTNLNTLETTHKKLLTQYELAYDLNSIEAQVTSNGSMVKPESGQIYTLDLSEPDSVVRYHDIEQSQQATVNLWDEVWTSLCQIVEYFR